jgi:hypothetical protein
MAAERFGCIRDIAVGDEASWRERVFLTLDVDWANDEVIAFAADLLEGTGVAATWFVTHETAMLERLRCNPRFELGIHPNFNFLLTGDPCNGANADEVLDRLLAIVPEATAVRSHSMTQSSVLLDLFARRGLTHDCNHYVPGHAGIELRPWRIWNGLTKVPYCWEDDLHCITDGPSPSDLAARPGLCVVDFHPIHLFLNTEDLARYEGARPDFASAERLRTHRFAGAGTRTWLEQLVSPGETGT